MSLVVRALSPDEDALVDLVAERMAATLDEVIGPDRDVARYDHGWLVHRVRQHLAGGDLDGAGFVAELEGTVVGHTLVRLEGEERRGLYATTWVAPDARRAGVASALLDAGEAWLVDHGAASLATATDAENTPLIRLYQRRGFAISLRDPTRGMVLLSRDVAGPPDS